MVVTIYLCKRQKEKERIYGFYLHVERYRAYTENIRIFYALMCVRDATHARVVVARRIGKAISARRRY